jgi:GMP synthase-like glutamine amidotransferase
VSERAVLYVYFDRPEDAGEAAHAFNIQGLVNALRPSPLQVSVLPVHARSLRGRGDAELRARFSALGIFLAGSFTEWFQYGVDAEFRRTVDEIAPLLRGTQVPLLAVCGGHQLLAAAMNGFGAIVHMGTEEPVTIASELALASPRLLAPSRRVGQEGTYPLALTAEGEADALFACLDPRDAWVSQHHKDMVVNIAGARLLATDDSARRPRTTAAHQAACQVQAVRWGGRPACYGVQFHPEVGCFAEAASGDEGNGARLLRAFVSHAALRSP